MTPTGAGSGIELKDWLFADCEGDRERWTLFWLGVEGPAIALAEKEPVGRGREEELAISGDAAGGAAGEVDTTDAGFSLEASCRIGV